MEMFEVAEILGLTKWELAPQRLLSLLHTKIIEKRGENVMTQRWAFTQTEREELRRRLGQILLGPAFKPEEPIIKQLAELRGPILGQRLGLLGFLAGSSPEPEKPKEEFPMPPDYAGGPEEWQKLTESEKRAIYEALRQGRKIYVSLPTFESKHGLLDSEILQAHKLKQILSGS